MLRKHFALVVFLWGCWSATVSGQLANTTSLVGNVIDAAGASMTGVAITAVNTGTSDTYSVLSNNDGYYSIEFIKVGTYRITAKQTGFETLIKDGVIVDANETVRTDFTMQIGQVSQTLEVHASTPPISTDEASIREVVTQKAVAELPLNGRDPLQLAITTPGVIQGLKGANGTPPGEDFIGAGTREIQNSVSLDGISIMNNLITTTSYHPSVDSIQEFQIQTGTYSAQYGAYLGAHLDLITKSGTNSLHGAVFEFLRNDVLDARPYFLSATQKKAPLRQNQFGFEVGGPVFIPKLYNGRNKTFFMADYEGLRLVKSVSQLTTVLTPLMRQGNFSEILPGKQLVYPGTTTPVAGNIIPANLISPQALKALQYLPLPNQPGLSNNLAAIIPNNDKFNQTVDRIDQNIGERIRLFFRYAWQNEQIFTGDPNPFDATTTPVNTRNWVVGYTQTLTPSMVNDFRVGRQNLVTNSLNYWYTNNLRTAGADLGIPGFTGDVLYGNPGVPGFTISGFNGIGNAATNWFQTDTTWQGTDSFTYTHSAHTIIGGAELRKLITGRTAVNSAQGTFSFTGAFSGYAPADLLFGVPQNDTTPGPEIRNIVAEWRDGFFVVDNWRATKNLTLNLGVRYELPTVPYTKNGYATILNASQTALIPSNPPVPGFKLIEPNHDDVAPRFGLAYRVTEKTVIRLGYGIYYNPNQTNTFTFLSSNPPFANTTTFSATGNTPTLTLNNPVPASSLKAASLANVISPNAYLPSAYMHQWSFDFEQGLWANSALDLQYLGSHSLHLDRSYYDNTPLPGPGNPSLRRPNPNFAQIRIIQNDEIANYDGFSAILRQRFSHGITGLASYTWAHDLDVTTDSNGGGSPLNPYNWRADYGNSNWDIRHRFVASFNYEIPFFRLTQHAFIRETIGGWQMNGIVIAQSGLPFNVTIPNDQANTTLGSQRPNIIGPTSANCGNGDPRVDCINVSAFALPALYTYGNAGRNLLTGPGQTNVDFSLFKNFGVIKERIKIQFRAEAFNLLNTPEFNNPNTTLPAPNSSGTYTGVSLGNFGTISSTRHDNRDLQFGLKFLF